MGSSGMYSLAIEAQLLSQSGADEEEVLDGASRCGRCCKRAGALL